MESISSTHRDKLPFSFLNRYLSLKIVAPSKDMITDDF